MNREYMKGVAMFILDLAMELEYQRRYPRRKVTCFENIEFHFDGDGECEVFHNDTRMGEISIDPDEIEVTVGYRNKCIEIKTESDQRLSSRDIMDIVGDFLDYDPEEYALKPAKVERVVVSQAPSPTQYPVRRWLIEEFVKYMYSARPEAEQGLQYEQWLTCMELTKYVRGSFAPTDTSELTEMEFCNTLGKLGFLPKENFEDNLRTVVNWLTSNKVMPDYLRPHCAAWMPTGDE